MINLKYDLLGRPIELKKTHDFCASKQPKITVVFIHGIASDSTTFHNTLRYLEGTTSMKDVRFVTFDLLGAGKSYRNDKLKYGYTDQINALEMAIIALNASTPLVLVGHSMGCLIATRYAATHKKAVAKLVLCSPPIFTEEDLDKPAFTLAIDAFRKAVSVKNRKILKDKAFNNEIEHIVMNRKNYKTLIGITTPTVLIYGDADPFIAIFNLPKAVKANPKYLSKVKTLGRHSMSREKYIKVREVLEEVINA